MQVATLPVYQAQKKATGHFWGIKYFQEKQTMQLICIVATKWRTKLQIEKDSFKKFEEKFGAVTVYSNTTCGFLFVIAEWLYL